MAKSYIQIEGIFDTEVLGTFNIIRGFATLQELAEISVPVLMEAQDGDGHVQGHQRPIDEQHALDVKRYFEQGDQRFIPEIILSVRAALTNEMDGLRQLGVSYDTGGLVIRRKHTSKNIRIHTLRVKRKDLARLKQEKRIRRIDGNHRLAKAAELAPVAGQENRYKVPFCLLLLSEPGDTAHDYSEALVFHTINSTAKPLDGEQALQLILGQSAAHTMPPHQEFNFAPALHFTRLLDERLRALPEPARSRLGGRSLSRLSLAAKELLHSYPARAADLAAAEVFAGEIQAALLDLSTHLHGDFPDFCAADYFIELATHVWMRSAPDADHPKRLALSRDYLRDMAKWMGTDGLRGLSTGKPLGRQLTEIYDAVRSRVPKKVFLARWYPTVADGEHKTRADNRLAALKQLVEGQLGLELVDMGTEEGGTYFIHPKMYEAIGSSEIFIADLTGLRPNVMIELGYALNHQGTKRLLLMFNPVVGADKIPFDTNSFRYEQIGEAADIPAKLKGHLEEILNNARSGLI
ncbi:hypothetical protein QQ054_15955 [Oscillatoria amoena NRMC-F 0135]|nr:hypothetical protein [Oscillatoria laete-virens]MDL5047510.1 hypothetical protein [Oscillatoria amoena NRMC-F 0135]MDL5054665.1 hypothetical protein [Oscillatoria laete-virens NRMC-F 0139]